VGRLPATGLGTTSLGAVGGARGTAAGAIRILVEFLTQYDSKAVKQLEGDLNNLAAADNAAISRTEATKKALVTLAEKQLRLEKEIRKTVSATDHPRAVRTAISEARNVGLLGAGGQDQLREELAIRGLSERQINKIVELEVARARAIQAQVGFSTKLRNQQEAEGALGKQRLATEAELTSLQRLRANLVPKLGGLAIGAIGGIVGGAVLGVGFAAAEAGLEAVSERLKDIIDPARHAREELDGVAQAVIKLAEDQQGGTLQTGAAALLEQFGIKSDDRTEKILAEAAGLQFANDQLAERIRLVEILNHFDELRTETIRNLAAQLAREAGDTQAALAIQDRNYQGRVNLSRITPFLAEAERQLGGSAEELARRTEEANRQASLREAALKAQAAAAALAAVAEQNLAAALSAAAAPRLAGFDSQIARLQNSGPSARTLAIQAQIDKLQNAGSGGRQRSTELANIAEERALILLRMRLRLMGTNINLEKFSGKFLLEAINAKLAALQKEAAAQDRLNRLLDLQYRMSQRLQRNRGESITDFLQRRAKENRDLLTEQRNLERETEEEKLRDLQEKTQDEVQLRELAERAKTAAVQSGTDNRLRNLQKELQKSQEADRKALKAKIDAVNKAKKAYEDQYNSAKYYAQASTNVQIREAVRALKTVGDLSKISGSISGLTAAKVFLEALVASGALSPQQMQLISGALADINRTLNYYQKQEATVIAKAGHTPGTRGLRLAAGGFIPLSNASTFLGSNVQFGEQGNEAGLMVLPNRIAQAMKDTQGGIGDQNFYFNRSDDMLRDKYAFKQMVKEAVSEAMR